MAALTAQSIKDSFEQVLHVDTDGGGNGTTLQSVKDGDNGTTFALQTATDKIGVKGPTSSNVAEIGEGASDTDIMYLKLYDELGQAVYIWPEDTGGGEYALRLSTSKP